MKSVLLTGASGFIGRHTWVPLIKKGYTVHGIARHIPTQDSGDIIWHRVDLHDTNAIRQLLKTLMPSHLLHLAWYTKPNEYWDSPFNIDWMRCSINLLESFIQIGGKRIVMAGTCAEYKWLQSPCHEFDTPCIPETLYGAAKHSLYLISKAISQNSQLSLAWARLFFLFGGFEYSERFIPAIILSLLKRQVFTLKNSKLIRDYMYVADVADALVALLDSELEGPVNVASGKPIRLDALTKKIADKLEAVSYVANQNAPSSQPIVTANVTRLQNELNWQPSYSIDVALEQTITWWRQRLKNA